MGFEHIWLPRCTEEFHADRNTGQSSIIHDGDVFEAQGRVMNARPITGVGITFLQIEERYQLILDKWLTNLRNNSQHP